MENNKLQSKKESLEQLASIRDDIKESLKKLKERTSEDLEIDDMNLDEEVLRIPKLYSKYLNQFTDETIRLKDLYGFKEKIKLERWKYWSGKQTDQYYATWGQVHEKILKGDLDRYLSADDKLSVVNDIVSVQKALVDHLEKVIKEIGNRNFHIKAAIDWRRFTSGV